MAGGPTQPDETLPRILIATGNAAKLREMEQLLGGSRWRIVSFRDFPDLQAEVEETGCTYEENARLKAVAACEATGLISIADDAGLEIDALGGQPGVWSKRFLGEHTTFPEKMDRILALMDRVPDEQRGCRFRAAVVIAMPDGAAHTCYGVCEGRIARVRRGSYGFGYDPIFYLPEIGKHMAELPPSEKHKISHRGQALACARAFLESVLP